MILQVVTGKILETLKLCRADCQQFRFGTALESGAQFSLYGLRIWMRPEAPSMVRLSKSIGYLIDNQFVITLSVMKARGPGESGRPAEPVPNWESRAHPLRKGRGEG